jgi:hypothetical protein
MASIDASIRRKKKKTRRRKDSSLKLDELPTLKLHQEVSRKNPILPCVRIDTPSHLTCTCSMYSVLM